MTVRSVKEWSADLERAARGGLERELKKSLLTNALRAERRAKLLVSGIRLNVRTTALRASIGGRMGTVANQPSIILQAGGVVGSRRIDYARIHELGGAGLPVRPDNAGARALKARFYLRDSLRSVVANFRRDTLQAVARVLQGTGSR